MKADKALGRMTRSAISRMFQIEVIGPLLVIGHL
jgi:hypothetical protein